MARAKNIKPGFFTNEQLAECSFAARLLFVGLWTLADREGRLEDRPRRIRAQVFPYALHETLETMDLLVGAAKRLNISEDYPDPMLMASMGIPGYVMAKRADLVIVVHGLNVPASIPVTLARGGYNSG